MRATPERLYRGAVRITDRRIRCWKDILRVSPRQRTPEPCFRPLLALGARMAGIEEYHNEFLLNKFNSLKYIVGASIFVVRIEYLLCYNFEFTVSIYIL